MTTLNNLVYCPYYTKAYILNFINDFLNNKNDKYILGRNIYTSALLKFIDANGIIDDYTNEKEYQGKKIFKSEEISHDSLIIIASGGSTLSIAENLKKAGFKYFLDYFSFYKNTAFDLPELFLNSHFSEEYKKNKVHFDYIYSILEDRLSKNIFNKLVNFKNTYDIGYLAGFINNENDQYFDLPMLMENTAFFVDVGGYDGMTTFRFIERVPNYKGVYFFEPEIQNFEQAKSNLNDKEHIQFFNKGCSYRDETAYLTTDKDTSTISYSGNQKIHLVALDNILRREEGIFIKMDIEGAEYDAILGCRNVIKESTPTLAISIYHKVNDFWKIPFLVLSINPNYKIYIRHYTETVYETVMYFVPDNRL